MAEPTYITLDDDAGQSHQYEIRPWPSSKGVKIGRKLLAIFGPLIVRVIGAIGETRQTAQGVASPVASATGDATLATDVAGSDGEFNGDLAARGVERLAMAIVEHGDDKLLLELLLGASRDGKQLTHPPVFDAAFAANYGELALALGEVLKVNLGPSLRRFVAGLPNVMQGGGLGGVVAAKIASFWSN